MLHIKNLQISTHEQILVQPLSIHLEKGGSLGLVGESGSGKSLICKTIAGLLPEALHYQADRFSIHIGENQWHFPAPEEELRLLRKKHLGFVFQEPMSALNPIMTCGYQLAEALGAGFFTDKKIKNQALEWIEKVRLPDPERIYKAYPHQLSGGQRQRLMIAMAMAKKPSLLIADEPTTALDVWVQAEILKLIKDLQSDMGSALIFVSHDLDLVRQLADEILVLRGGVVQEQGDAHQVWNHPQSPYTKALIALKPKGSDKPKRLPVLEDFIENKGFQPEYEMEEKFGDKVLEIKNIYKTYTQGKKHSQALKDISLALFKGERLGIAGGSGCGKSTLGKIICGLEQAESGEIVFLDKKISQQRVVQLVFQDPFASLNPALRISTQLMEVLLCNGCNKAEAHNKALELFLKTGLKEEQFHRYPHEFSGGQRQRICIVRALLLDPSILICDESVSALDVSVSAQILNLLKDLRDELGFSLIFISHDLHVLRYFCTRMVIMDKGEIVEMGETEQVFTQPKSDFTKSLLDAVL